ncbi:MAG: PfkB family carbohydrate kinase [Chloroflexota bacterium]
MHVTGVGQCSLDLLAVVDRYPRVDSKKEVLGWHEQGGGPVATALVTLSRLGVASRFYGVVGDDEAGVKIRKGLAEEGVDASGIKVVNGAASQIAFIVIEKKTARRTIFWRRPTGGELTAEDLPDTFPDETDFVLIDGLMADVSLDATRKARERGIPVMVDAGRMRPRMPEIAKLSDYVVASVDFARDLGWRLTRDTLLRERERLGVKALTVTLGSRGSLTAAGEDFYDVQAHAVDAVDTTGAGDVFHGGYIYGLLRGWGLSETVNFASAVAAMKCRAVGGRTAIPRLHEVREFMAERGHSIADV